MKTSFLKVVLLSCFLIIPSVNISAQDDMSSVRSTIEALNQEMAAAMVAGEYAGMNKFYTEDVISLPDFEPAIRGLDNIMEKAKKDMEAGFKVLSADFKTTDVFGSGDLAVEVGEWTMKMEIPEMENPWEDTGKYVTLWQKQDDGNWKIKVETWNTNTNPWQNMEQATNKE